MASYTGILVARHKTFSTTVADLAEFAQTIDAVTVTNRDGTNTLYFNVNSSTTPAAAGDDLFVLPPHQSMTVPVPPVAAGDTPGSTAGKQCVRLVGSGGGWSVMARKPWPAV